VHIGTERYGKTVTAIEKAVKDTLTDPVKDTEKAVKIL
jgi:hypothetical protein